MKVRTIAASLAVAVGAVAVSPMVTEASSNFDLRKRVIGVSGIMSVLNLEKPVTRGEFAAMLVSASPYRSYAGQTSATSVFADVPRDHEYAVYIRLAAEQGLMSGYLGGNFKPGEYITLKDGVKGILGLLGYGNSDFTGDQIGSRLSKYHFLDLDENIEKQENDVLKKEDCLNLFYNLLKTDTKSGAMFGKSLGCELTSDGEINPFTMTDNSIRGPKVLRTKSKLKAYLPFEFDHANIYLDGEPASSFSDAVGAAFDGSDGVLVYYHSLSKTLWLYTVGNESENGRSAVYGQITNVIYNSADLMMPDAIILSDGNTYELEGTEMQFVFSSYGGFQVGDPVYLVYTVAMDNEQNQVRTVIDYMED